MLIPPVISTQEVQQPSATTQPVVFATTAKVSEDEETFEQLSDKQIQELTSKGYVVVPFKDFLLIFPENAFGLRDSEKQCQVLKDCAAALASPKHLVKLSELPKEDEQTVRKMIAESGEDGLTTRSAANPDLKMQLGVRTVLSERLGSKRADLVLEARGPTMKEVSGVVSRDTQMKTPVASPQAMMAAQRNERKLTLVFPEDHPSALERLSWSAQVETYMLDKCKAARERYTSQSAAFLDTLRGEDTGRYGQWSKDHLMRFTDMSKDEQFNSAQNFYGMYRTSLFPSENEADSFLANAQTDSSQSYVVLSAFFETDRGPGWVETHDIRIPFSCPVDR